MRKFFLIPLMTLCTCVMAWAEPVTTLEELQAALNAGGEITLTADINAGSTELVSAGTTTLDLNGQTLSGAKNNGESGVIKVTGGSLTINATNGGTISAGTQLNAVCVKGGTLTINAGTFNGSYEAIYGTAGTININGGTFTTTYDNAVWAKGAALNITGGNFDGAWYDVQSDAGSVTRISGGTFAGDNDGTLAVGCYAPGPDLVVTGGTFNGTAGIGIWTGAPVIRGGSFAANPVSFVNLDSYVVTKPSTMYVVSALSADVVAYNIGKSTTHTSLSDAIDAASNGNEIYLYKNDATAITVSKSITVKANGHTTNLSAGSGYARADMGQNIVFTDNAIAAFLMTDGTASLTVSENADISNAGAIHVNGDKTLTINAGVEILYKRQSAGANIIVDNGAKLTVLGSGSFKPVMHSETITVGGFTAETNATAGNQIGNRIIDVDGELVVGVKDDANNCPHFITSSLLRGSAITVNPSGIATFNNADIDAANAIIWNDGKMTINGGEYVSHASMYNGINNGVWSYGLRCGNGSRSTINGGHVVGTQGAVAVYADATADINGGSFETVYGYNYKTGVANAKDNHYALYVARLAIVNVYGGDFKVQTPNAGSNNVVLSGNDDAFNTYGVINIYGGRYQKKAQVSPKKNGESAYPASVPATSAWYSSFAGEAPLPAGYEYYETGDATYPYGVRAIAGKEADGIDPAKQAEQEADPTYTIPWQQATTWATDEVPETNTIVTIPVDATVTVSKDEAVKEAVADQVYVAQGATLKVEEGTTLTVGNGGMNIGNGGQIVVEAGATVKIGSAGVITTEKEALVIESNDDVQGVLLYEPSVAENTQPKATIKLTTKAKQIGANSYVFERFAIPTVNGSATTYSIEGGFPTSGLYNDAPSFLQAVWEWNNATDEWEQLDKFKDMQPFHGYQLTNNTANGGLVYVFEGNLVGNQSMDYEFVENGFHFFGNSYSADINIKSFLNSLGADVEKTVWVYDPYDKTFKTITERMANGRVKYGNGEAIKDVRSMQAFLMYLADGESGTANVNYASAIWGNPKYNGGAGAPARQAEGAEDWMTIRVSAANGLKDEVILNQSEEFSAAFENGADANKFMNKENINLYAATNAGNLAVLATNDLNNTVLTFAAGNATEYTLTFADIEGNEYTLRDNVTGATMLMTEGATYTFEQEANTTVPARFELLGAAKMPTAIENIEAVAKKEGIYTVAGQFMGRDFSKLPAGVYVVNGVKIVK